MNDEKSWRKAIADQVRRNCTPSSEAYEKGGDYLIWAVADWIENPPEWSKLYLRAVDRVNDDDLWEEFISNSLLDGQRQTFGVILAKVRAVDRVTDGQATWARKVLGMADDEPNEATGFDTREAFARLISDRVTVTPNCECGHPEGFHAPHLGCSGSHADSMPCMTFAPVVTVTPNRADLAEIAYRAFCDARAGREMSEGEYEAIKSRVELKWLGEVVAALSGLFFPAVTLNREVLAGLITARIGEHFDKGIFETWTREDYGYRLADRLLSSGLFGTPTEGTEPDGHR